ncbi:hypothetical protein OIE90_20450 [Streptomyces cellulosae]|uniref:M23 family peptidase n=2 Tax=Streptomyces TaxID=1883 RepID=A0ABU3JAM4_9ACTN|nr:hypothetical protein [Streptomyces thermodiastaticus]MDT6972107.1 hypothetical protein [Streptomyces thermocarboxydus]WSB43124.1 hypothetical protein OG853_20745 [Streptomyces cellulosae]WSB55972.1 hypothetical protein OG880_20260 [Streptomyces cellulosae]WTB71031.1 hypothetical protein OIE90_20450 [Streptomyces cellulosae]
MRLGANRAFRPHTERIGVEELLRRVRDAAGPGRPFRLLPARRRSRRAVAVSAALATGAVPVLGYGVDRATGTPGETVPEPPFSPAESVPAMGRYL